MTPINTAGRMLGFTHLLHTVSDIAPLTSDSVVQVYTDNAVYIRTNLHGSNIYGEFNGMLSNVLAKIPIDSEPNTMIVYRKYGEFKCDLNERYVRDITLSLTDNLGRLIDLNGLHWQVSIEFTHIKRIME
jgi:hypothetical protein